jgi:4'-phosphopantetheinyl transferase
VSDIIQVWRIALDDNSVSPQSCALTLSSDEKLRAARFRKESHRRRWRTARYALRCILAQWVHTDPRRIQFVAGRNDKPLLADGISAEPVHFNLSHSNEMALVAITAAYPVGIDVEFLRPFNVMSRVAEKVFTPEERAQLDHLGKTDYVSGFYTAWTRKEALIKATGEGLSAALQSIEVALSPDEPPGVRRFGDDDPTRWRLYDIDAGDRYRAALATRSAKAVTPIMRRFDLL